MKYVILISVFFGWNAFAAPTFKLAKEKGETHFLALGNPSAIRIDGKGEGPEGNLVVQEKGENLLVSGDLRVSLKNTDTGIALRDRHMKDKYLEVSKYEHATLSVSELAVPKTALQKETETKIPLVGVLDLHGVKKNIQGALVVKNTKEGVQLKADFQIKISDFGILIPSFAGITVADQVEVSTTSTLEMRQ